MTASTKQLKKAAHAAGFIAALDQSGGSTPKALNLYGVSENDYSDDSEMFAKVHQMRARIITNSAFGDDKILAAILFENTMQREIEGKPTARYLWEEKNILPILKVDKGLADEANGVQIMKPMPDLEALLEKANTNGIFGTKMRSVIKHANAGGIAAVVEQQFATAKIILSHGLIPIIEPEVDIHSPQKTESEVILRTELSAHLDRLAAEKSSRNQKVMLKLTLPESPNFYQHFVTHPNCLRVAALSGGYSREQACRRLSENHGMIASFSRALTEGLSINQTDQEFTATLSQSIAAIATASST